MGLPVLLSSSLYLTTHVMVGGYEEFSTAFFSWSGEEIALGPSYRTSRGSNCWTEEYTEENTHLCCRLQPIDSLLLLPVARTESLVNPSLDQHTSDAPMKSAHQSPCTWHFFSSVAVILSDLNWNGVGFDNFQPRRFSSKICMTHMFKLNIQ